jgi:hypothetical protein
MDNMEKDDVVSFRHHFLFLRNFPYSWRKDCLTSPVDIVMGNATPVLGSHVRVSQVN